MSLDSETISAEAVRAYAQGIAKGAAKMENIITNLLLLASARRMDVEMQPLDMAQVVDGALERLVNVVEQSHAEIVLPQTWPVALGYAPWVEEVWVNYLSNALKYGGDSDKGIAPYIEVGFDETPVLSGKDETAVAQIRFWVRDNGKGLTPKEQKQLFMPFERLDQVRIKGHGLGLSIVRRIVEKLEGEVGVESKVGQGSLFYFTLPAFQMNAEFD